MRSNALATADVAQPFSGGGLNVDPFKRDAEIASDVFAHAGDVRGYPGGLGDDSSIHVADRKSLLIEQGHHSAQQDTAIDALQGGIAVREVLTDIATPRGTEKRVAEGVQQHIAVGMGNQSSAERNTHAPQSDEIAVTEAVDIEAVADAQRSLHGQACLRAR